MGFKLGRSLKKLVKSAVKSLPGAIGGFITGGPTGALVGAFSRKLGGGGELAPVSDVGAGVPSIQTVTGIAPFFGQGFRNGSISTEPVGGIQQVQMGSIALRMGAGVVRAITILASRLGVAVSAASLGRVGMRLWRSIAGLARRHPGISILTFLTGLGLSLDEAGEFLFWGQTRTRRRRRRGISGRDIAITRRTLRRLDMFRARLGGRGRVSRRRGGGRRDGTVVVAQQD